MKTIKNFIIAMTVVLSTITTLSTQAHAANYTTEYWKYSTPTSTDYAYWNGSRVVKSRTTTKSDMRWMQATLNHCIAMEGLQADYIDVDGSLGPASCKLVGIWQQACKDIGIYKGAIDSSFGPQSIACMLTVLNDEKATFASEPVSAPKNETTITTEAIYEVLNKYGYKTGAYWTRYEPSVKNNDCSKVRFTKDDDLYASSNKATANGSYKSYNYEQSWECAGFSRYVMAKVTGTNCIPRNGSDNNWEKLTNVSELQVGDIVVTTGHSTGHSAIVLSVNGKNCTFAEVWGSYGSKISVNGKFNGRCSTLEQIKNTYHLDYVYRFRG